MKRLSYLLVAVSLSVSGSYAQDEPQTQSTVETQALRAEDNGGYNPLSRRAIHLSDQMYRKTVWRKIDMREKQNKPLFSNGRELSLILIDAVKQGKLTPYKNDSCNTPLTAQEFDKAIMIPGAEQEEEDGFSDDAFSDGGGGWDSEGAEEEVAINPYYIPKTLYVFEIKEDMIFDKQRSRMYYDIQSLSMYVPSDNSDNIKSIEIPIASFRYVDLLKVFQDDPRAFWFNPANDAAHRNYADAFDLRLFSSYIIKLSNPDNAYLEDIYGSPEAGIRASYTTMYNLLEFEHNLWEF